MDSGFLFSLILGALAIPLFAAIVGPEIVGDTMLGVDLGTTFSVAAVCHGGVVRVVEANGQYTTPSVVYFDGASALVGAPAVDHRSTSPKQTIYDAKRLIGRNFTTDKLVQEEMKELSYDVKDGGDGSVVLDVPGVTTEGPITPQTVGKHILAYLKRHSEAFLSPWRQRLGFKFKSVTVSVPVAFSTAQRAATVKAGEAAGFRMVRILEEPIAAALAFGLHTQGQEVTVLVYDMGGGTLDVAMLRLDIRTRTFLTLSTAGDPHLGGEDIDRALARHFEGRLPAALQAAVPRTALRAALLQGVEAAKRRLSSMDATPITLRAPPPDARSPAAQAVHEALREWDGVEVGLELTRAVVEEVCGGELARGMEPVFDALQDAGMAPPDVDHVVMVGGSSRLVAMRNRLGKLFAGKVLNYDIDPDTAIAIGAARSFGC